MHSIHHNMTHSVVNARTSPDTTAIRFPAAARMRCRRRAAASLMVRVRFGGWVDAGALCVDGSRDASLIESCFFSCT